MHGNPCFFLMLSVCFFQNKEKKQVKFNKELQTIVTLLLCDQSNKQRISLSVLRIYTSWQAMIKWRQHKKNTSILVFIDRRNSCKKEQNVLLPTNRNDRKATEGNEFFNGTKWRSFSKRRAVSVFVPERRKKKHAEEIREKRKRKEGMSEKKEWLLGVFWNGQEGSL